MRALACIEGSEGSIQSAIAKTKRRDTYFSYGCEMFNLKKDVYFITLLLIFILYTYIYIAKNMLRILKNNFSNNTVIIIL